MKRSESLDILSRWAGARNGTCRARAPRDFGAMIAAQKHGSNAVRAVRAIAFHVAESPRIHGPGCSNYAVSEARAAFRAALQAVGLKTL